MALAQKAKLMTEGGSGLPHDPAQPSNWSAFVQFINCNVLHCDGLLS